MIQAARMPDRTFILVVPDTGLERGRRTPAFRMGAAGYPRVDVAKRMGAFVIPVYCIISMESTQLVLLVTVITDGDQVFGKWVRYTEGRQRSIAWITVAHSRLE